MPKDKSSGKKLADMMYGSDQMRATPQSRITGPVANALRKAQQFASQYEVSPRIPLLGGTGVDELLSLPEAASLMEDISYNGPGALIRGGNVATGGIGTFRPDPRIASVADVAGTATGVGSLATKGATQGALAAGRAGSRLADRAVPRIMERGGLGADILSGMAQGTQSKIFIGPKAKTFNQAKADEAVRLEQQGVDPTQIWLATGTFRGADGILRQEIDDRAAKFLSADERKERLDATKAKIAEMKEKIKPTPQKDLFPKALTEAKKEIREDISILQGDVKGRERNPRTQGLLAQHIFEHPELYAAYPELQNVNFVTEGGSGGTLGALSILPSRGFIPGSMEIDIYDKGLRNNPTSTALHEMQHAVQTLEGMGPGGNPTMAFTDLIAHKMLQEERLKMLKALPYEDFVRQGGYTDMEQAGKDYAKYTKDLQGGIDPAYDRMLQQRVAMEYYKRLAGEAEARAVQDRQMMTPAQRMETPPPASYDVPQEDLIVKPPREYADGGAVHMEKGGAAFGVFPQMKGKRSKQDPEAAKNFPVDLARGVIAGAVGMPGDIESLARLPYELITGNDSPTILPTSEDVLKRIPFGSDTPASQFASGLGTLAGGSANIGAAPRMVKKGALAAGRAGERMAEKVVPGIMERGGAGADILSGLAQGSRSQVIKPKGGNWLGGNLAGYIDPSIARLKPYGGVDESLDRAKKSLARMEERADSFKPRDIQAQRDMVADLEAKFAVENWVTRNLGNYVKKQMGTPEDPVRALHEQGITHLGGSIDDLDLVADQSLRQRRAEAGFPAEGMGQSEMARKYENLTDEAITSISAGDVQKSSKALSDAQEAERAFRDYQADLGQRFTDHLKSKGLSESEVATLSYKTPVLEKAYILGDKKYDELALDAYSKNKALNRNAVGAAQANPWIEKLAPETELYSGYVSDLGFDHVIDVLKQDVQSGRIRPEQLNKVSMEQAVRRTYEYDQEMAKKMREAAIKATEGFPTYKEYPKGYRWIELKVPDRPLPEGYTLGGGNDKFVFDPSGKDVTNPNYKALEDALKYEGEAMGHCVGGYCPDVIEGRSRIFSLRDAKGEPHVTVEVEPAYRNRGFREGERPTGDEYYQLQEQYVQGQKTGEVDPNLTFAEWWRSTKGIPEEPEIAPQIVQIKGKQNRAPKDEYLPFVQDFVKSGNWSDVGDLENTGLMPIEQVPEKSRYEAAGMNLPRYLTSQERDELLNEYNRLTVGPTDPDFMTKAYGLPPPQDGMAHGGRVHISDNPDVMQLELAGGGLVKGLKAAAKAAKPAEAPMKASEALGRVEGRPLVITQADRTKVGGGFLGGPGFSGLQLEDPAYRAAEAAWGVKTPGVAKMILGGGKAAGKDPVYAAMLGTPTQHQSNQMVFDKLLGDFKKAAKKGGLDPDLRDRINMRLANTVDKEGNPIFPPDVDILGKNFKELANTFDRRAVTANLIGGMGVGGKKGQIIDYDKIIRETTGPLLLDAPTGALGNRLFTLSGGIIDRPDLHPAFPTILQGEDLGVSFNPVARDLVMKDFIEQTMREKGRAPGYMDYTRGYPPSQLITEDLLTELQKLGLKEGGAVTKDEQRVQNPVHFTENPDAMRLALSKRN